jgi:hypothetical protein
MGRDFMAGNAYSVVEYLGGQMEKDKETDPDYLMTRRG